jgi:ATP-dependent helicase/nuclease subunit B
MEQSQMNCLFQAIRDACNADVLGEKTLVAPSLRVGHQWLDAVVRSGQPAVNVRINTIKGLALELAGPEMAAKGVRLIAAEGAGILVDAIAGRLLSKESGYLAKLQQSPGLSQTMHAAIEAVRLAGMDAAMLKPGAFEVAAKAKDIAKLLNEYLRQLNVLKLVDYAEVLRMAKTRLTTDRTALAVDAWYLIPEDLELTALERELLDLLPKKQVLEIGVDRPLTAQGKGSKDLPDAGLLRWLPNPGEAPSPKEDGTAAIFRAIGEVNEVREVFRRCVEAGTPLDQVEVLHTDTETYVPLFYELGWRLRPDSEDTEGLPITFAEGIPVRYSRPGRALMAWLAWVTDDFPQATLVRMIQDGLLAIPEHDRERFSFSSLAIVLRSVGIGLGRERYCSLLEEQISGCEKRLANPEEFVDEDGQIDGDKQAALERRLESLRLLNWLLQDLVAITPPAGNTPKETLIAAGQFLGRFTRAVNEFDNYALEALTDEVQGMQDWLKQVEGALSHDFREWLAGLVDQVRVGGSGPRPGCLHIAHALTGGHSGRPITYIVGLDDSRFPGAGLQDPLLLDHERQALSPKLPTAAGRLKEKLDKFARLMARLRGRVTLSYCCHNLLDDREMFPSRVILAVFRILSGKHDGDQSDILRWLPPPASFAPQSADRSLDEADWWLWRLCGPESVGDISPLIAERFPHLGRGQRAVAERAGEKFTAFDGMVPEAGRTHDPTKPDGPILSASSLETIGRCPLAWFFHYVLRLEPPEELVVDLTRWLDPLAFGTLLHEVFRQFMAALRKKGLRPKASRDTGKLNKILDEQIAVYRKLCPPPNESVFRAQRRQLYEAAQIFLAGEDEFCKESCPEYLEASLGMPTDGESSELDDPDPILVSLPDGKTFRARGRIDRIDRIGNESACQFSIWDYKTGRVYKKYKDGDPFAQGRLVQHALYLAMAEAVLKRKVNRKAVVKQAGYYFPTRRGQGERIVKAREDLADSGDVMQRLCQIVANGAFLATDNPEEDCGYCNYSLICHDLSATAVASQLKLDNGRNQALKPMRELRADD